MKEQSRDHWSSKLGFILAAAGSAVGLGNLWKFPYISWQNGGGLFILIYLVCIALVGLPIMIAEISIGKLSEKDPVGAFRALGGKKSPFRFVGILGIITAFVILSYYAVVAGWGIQYSIFSIQGKFHTTPHAQVPVFLSEEENLEHIKSKAFEEKVRGPLSDSVKRSILSDAGVVFDGSASDGEKINELWSKNRDNVAQKLQSKVNLEKWQDRFYFEKQKSDQYLPWVQEALLPAYSGKLFSDFLGDTKRTILFHTIVMALTMLIVIGGIHGGIERFTRIFMPLLFIIMIILVVNSLMLDKEQEGIRFLLFGDSSKLNRYSFLEALGHAFFTLSLGMGAMMTYGSYMQKNANVVANSLWVTAMDTVVALLACLMIFPIIFSYGLEPKEGIGILFTTLPLELFKFKGGAVLSLIFYCLVLLAAFTSAISLLEVVVSFLIDEFGLSRKLATTSAGTLIYLAGIPSAMDVNFLSFADSIATNYLLPAGGFLIAVFAGYKVDFKKLQKIFEEHHYPLWSFLAFRISIRYITPVLVILVMATPLLRKYF